MLTVLSVLLAATPPVDVGRAIEETNHTFLRDGEALVALTSTHHVTVTEAGELSLEGRQPVRFSVRSVRRDGAPCEATALAREAVGRVVTTQRACALVETWTNLDEGLEQELVLSRAPAGRGPLRVRLDVSAPWHHADARGHLFAGPGGEALGVRYGNAFLVTHQGQRVPVSVTHEAGGLELLVPEALLDAPDAFPLHLDPLVSGAEQAVEVLTNSPNAPVTDELEVAVAPILTTGQPPDALVVWVDRRRVLNTDLFGAIVHANGTILTFPVMVAPLDQRQPTVVWSPALSRWFVAWQQLRRTGGSDVGLCTVEAPTMSTPVTVTRLPDAPGRNAPSLAVDAMGNPLIALGPDPTVIIAPVAMTGVQPQTFSVQAPPGAAVTKTALASGDTQVALGLEFTVANTSHVAFYLPDPANPTAPPLTFSDSALAQRSPVARFFGGSPWFAYEQAQLTGPSTDTMVFRNAVNEQLQTIPGAHSPSLFSTGLSLYLGTLNDATVTGLTIQALAVAAGPIAAPFTLNLVGELNPSPLVLAPLSGQQLLAAWTAGFLNRDVKASIITLGATPSMVSVGPRAGTLATANPPQRSARVAMQGTEGLIVWLEGANGIRGERFSLTDAGVQLSAPASLGPPLLPLRLDSLDLSMAPNGAALVTWSVPSMAGAGGPSAIRLAAGPLATGTRVTIVPSGTGNLVGLPAAAWDGSQFVLAWLDSAGLLQWVNVSNAGTAGSPQSTPATGNDLRVGCLNGKCIAVWSDTATTGIALKRLGNNGSMARIISTPNSTSNRPLVTDDGTRFQLVWMTPQGFQYASYDEASDTVSLGHLQPYPTSPPTSAALAASQPPTLVWSDDSMDPPRVTLSRGADTLRGMEGFDVAVATAPGNRGVVVAQRWQAQSFDLVAFVSDFTWVPPASPDGGSDAGLPVDAGVLVDAGVDDAGLDAGGSVDAGTDGGTGPDAGTGPITYDSRGCPNCSSSPSVLMVGIAFVLLRRRRS